MTLTSEWGPVIYSFVFALILGLILKEEAFTCECVKTSDHADLDDEDLYNAHIVLNLNDAGCCFALSSIFIFAVTFHVEAVLLPI